MSAQGLGSRAIIGEFYKTLEMDVGASWLNAISMYMPSDQDSETYKWLGMAPVMREWLGGRNVNGFRENGITLTNKHYEATIEVLKRELRRDKTGQVMVRVREMAQRANSHWASLLSTLILNGTSTACYDGQFFFDTDHSEGDSGTQSNDITTDISALPANVHGSVTAPSVEEAQQAILKSVAQILGFKDDRGEPMNENASNFLVMVPTSLFMPFNNALAMPYVSESVQRLPQGLNISLVANTRLTGTDDFYTFRTDGNVKPFIRQEEQGVQMKAKAEGSEYEFDNDAHQYGIDTWREVGYGYWQHACYNQLT
jgi:phage major head subunit gpT-like protein